MSCYTIYYKDGAKMMRPVLTREEYLQLRDSSAQKAMVRQVRNGNGNAKMRLLQCNYSCLPNEDGTLKGSTQMTTTVGMDVDHIAKEQMQEVKERILAKKDELGLLMLELSARGEGYHLVFKRKAELSQEDNLHRASDLLGVEFDKGAKDITRVFFTTTASEEDLLFLDDGLFTTVAIEIEANTNPTNDTNEVVEAKKDSVDSDNSCSTKEMSLDYDGVPYATIIEALENQLGGVPAHGSRNQFIFSMACHLRYICNDDPEWIAEVLPTYGEGREKWMNTIKSACNRSQNKTFPKILRTAIEQARLINDNDNDDDNMVGTDGSGNGALPPEMPSKLPPLVKLLISKTPKIYQPAVAHAIFPGIGYAPVEDALQVHRQCGARGNADECADGRNRSW